MEFPRQDLPESNKDPKSKEGRKWFIQHLDYARELHNSHQGINDEMFKKIEKRSTNLSDDQYAYVTNVNGKKSKFPLKDYKLGRTKLQSLKGEYLQTNINPFITTVNKEAIEQKMTVAAQNMGMMEASDIVQDYRDNGLDVFNGAPVPDKEKDDLSQIMNPVTENEILITEMMKQDIKRQFVKMKGSLWLDDLLRVKMCFGKSCITENGEIIYKRIPPYRAIFSYNEDDMYLQYTPIIGERGPMPVNDVLTSWTFTDKEREKLWDISQGRAEDYDIGDNIINKYYSEEDGETSPIVTQIEWFGVTPVYHKIYRDTKDPLKKKRQHEVSPEIYERDKKKIEKDIAAGKYEIEKGYKTNVYQATQIGHDIYKDFSVKPYQAKDPFNPSDGVYSFFGLILPEVPIADIIENFDELYNIIMWQISRETAKNKGDVMVFDRAMKPGDKTMNEIFNEGAEEGVVEVDSSQDGLANQQGAKSGVHIESWSTMSVVRELRGLKADIENTVDLITGMSQERTGDIPATQTATGVNQSIAGSLLTTEPITYFHNNFMENSLMRLMNYRKISASVFDNEENNVFYSEDQKRFIRITKDLMIDDYVVSIGNPSEERRLRRLITKYSEIAINAKKLEIQDAMKAEMSDTIPKAIKFLDEAMERVKEIEQRTQNRELEMRQDQFEKGQQKIEEEREDVQKHELEKITLDGKIKSDIEKQKANSKLKSDAIKVGSNN